jgi:iron-sulfur cluster assembly accessory protein
MMRKGLFILACLLAESQAFVVGPQAFLVGPQAAASSTTTTTTRVLLFSQVADNTVEEIDNYEVPEDAVVQIKPAAMKRLRELKEKEKTEFMVLRMGVRNGGCSGLSYVMDFSTEDAIEEDDAVDFYPDEKLKCVVDAKSMLYLYGLELDYSEELIGGGFKFFNPNAEESCGCGSSFGV